MLEVAFRDRLLWFVLLLYPLDGARWVGGGATGALLEGGISCSESESLLDEDEDESLISSTPLSSLFGMWKVGDCSNVDKLFWWREGGFAIVRCWIDIAWGGV